MAMHTYLKSMKYLESRCKYDHSKAAYVPMPDKVIGQKGWGHVDYLAEFHGVVVIMPRVVRINTLPGYNPYY